MSMPFESVAPDEHVIASALFRCRRPGETLWHDAPGFLTNYRVAAYDQNGFVFNIFFRRLARAEMRKTTWQGPQLFLVLQDGGTEAFNLNGGDTALTQRWANKINEFLVVRAEQHP